MILALQIHNPFLDRRRGWFLHSLQEELWKDSTKQDSDGAEPGGWTFWESERMQGLYKHANVGDQGLDDHVLLLLYLFVLF